MANMNRYPGMNVEARDVAERAILGYVLSHATSDDIKHLWPYVNQKIHFWTGGPGSCHRYYVEAISQCIADGLTPGPMEVITVLASQDYKQRYLKVTTQEILTTDVMRVSQLQTEALTVRNYVQELVDEDVRAALSISAAKMIDSLGVTSDPEKVVSDFVNSTDRAIEDRKGFVREIKALGEISDHFFDTPPPPTKMLLITPATLGEPWEKKEATGFLARGIVGLLGADGGTGKTRALLQMALSIATGTPWLGTFNPYDSEGKIFMLLAEETQAQIHNRMFWVARGLGLDPDQLEVAKRNIFAWGAMGRRINFIDRDGKPTRAFGSIKRALEAKGGEWSAVLLDPLVRLAGATENDNNAASDFMNLCEELTQLPGNPTVVLARHNKKRGKNDDGSSMSSDDGRGASAFKDNARWEMQMRHVGENLVKARVVKSNYTKMGTEVLLRNVMPGPYFKAVQNRHET